MLSLVRDLFSTIYGFHSELTLCFIMPKYTLASYFRGTLNSAASDTLASYFRGTLNSAVSDINNLICHSIFTKLPYTFNVHFLIVFSALCMTYFTFFLPNLLTFSSFIILIFDVYFKQLVSQKYEAPVYCIMSFHFISVPN